jgi:hypothetical protein
MSIFHPRHMHIDDLNLSINIQIFFRGVRCNSSVHVDGINLIFGEVHHAIGISGVASEVGVGAECQVRSILVQAGSVFPVDGGVREVGGLLDDLSLNLLFNFL